MGPTKRSREYDGEATGGVAKKVRKAFRVGPANLPDGAWKRKNERIKQDLINKAKVRKAYKKIKANEFGDRPRRGPKPERTQPRQHEEEEGGGGGEDDDDEENLSSGSEEEGDDVAHAAKEVESEAEDDNEVDADIARLRNKRPFTKADENETTTTGDKPQEEKEAGKPEQDQYVHKDRQKNHQRKPGYFDKAKAEAQRRQVAADARKAEYERRNAERADKIAARERYNRALKKARTPGRDGQRRLGRESGLLLEKVKRMTGNQ